MQTRILLAAFVVAAAYLACATTSTAIAADVPIADALAQLMDDEAIAVSRIDLERADPVGLARIFTLLPDLAEAVRNSADALGIAQRVSTMAGPQLYFILSVPTGNQLPVLCVVPLSDAGRTATANQAFHISAKTEREWHHEVVDNLLIAGPKEKVARLLALREAARQGTLSTSPRPHLAAALAATADSPVAMAYVPSADQQRVLAELTPELPAEVGANTARDLARATRWVATAYEHGKSLRVILATESEAAAKGALENIDGLLGALMLQGRLTNPNSAEAQLFKLLSPALEAVKPRQAGDQIVLDLAGEQLAALFPPAGEAPVGAAGRTQAMNKLKHIALAMHNFHDTNNHFPDAASRDPQGKALLSWRVHILPYLEEGGEALYKEFKLDEPWDSDHNKKLIDRMPDVFKLPGSKAAAGKTCVVLPVGEKTVSPKGKGLSIRHITDGTSNTIMIVDADDDHAVTWTAPDDLAYDAEKPSANLSTRYGEGFLAVMCDGSVQFFASTVPVETVRALFTTNGREPINRP